MGGGRMENGMYHEGHYVITCQAGFSLEFSYRNTLPNESSDNIWHQIFGRQVSTY